MKPKAVIYFVLSFFLFASCAKREKVAMYELTDADSCINLPLLNWNVYGSFTAETDSLAVDSAIAPYAHLSYLKDKADATYQFSGFYQPEYGQVDLHEVYQIAPDDSTRSLSFHSTYLSCRILSTVERTLYLRLSSPLPATLWLNGDSLHRIDIWGLDVYPISLNKGGNNLVVKLVAMDDNYSMEATLCDEQNIARIFAEGQTGNIVYPEIGADNKTVMLTNVHQNILSSPVRLRMHDVNGHRIADVHLYRDSITYPIPQLEENKSYICSMTVCGATVRQAVFCGKDDDLYEHFVQLRSSLPDSHPRADEIDQLLYRLQFLLNHPSRHEGDWWWQFKLPALTYQLEHIFTHLDDSLPTGNEFNVQFKTYRSAQDDSLQRYLLISPNEIPAHKPMPLVVMMRPDIVNNHHFFASPQLARWWAVNHAQMLANRYGFMVMMPEMRFDSSGDLTSESEEEFMLTLSDLRKQYAIDSTRIFLHANCTGAYRALKLAVRHPGLFAAIGLYAPAYHPPMFMSEEAKAQAPEHFMKNLRHTPIMIHYDPLDTHSPYEMFADLVTDCRKYHIPLTLSVKRNSGIFYNVILVGEEVMQFFYQQTNKPSLKSDKQ